jgi:tRNA A-37 threonylcarbamoyl transferase component Bud32
MRDEAETYFGTGVIRLEPIRLTSGGNSKLLKLRVVTRASASYLYIKITKSEKDTNRHIQQAQERIQKEFATTTIVARALINCGFSAVRPLACFPDELSMITEEVPGQMLKDLLWTLATGHNRQRHIEYLTEAFERIGEWLRAFQQIDKTGTMVSIQEIWSSVNKSLSRTSYSDAERIALLRYVDLQSGRIHADELAEVQVHGDFRSRNIIVDGSRVTVLDFEETTKGTSYHDLIDLYIHLNVLPFRAWFGSAAVEHLRKAFFRGFGLVLDQHNPLFRVMLVQHTLQHNAKINAKRVSPTATLSNWCVWGDHRKWLNRLIRQTLSNSDVDAL